MTIVTYRTIFFWITGIVLAGAIGAIAFLGLPLGIDFTGGSLIQIGYPDGRPDISTIEQKIYSLELGTVNVRASGENGVSFRTRTLTPAEHTALIDTLSQGASVTELSYTSVGSTLGSQFANKALLAVLAVALSIASYIAFAFRRVSRPVPSWVYALTVIACLIHDLLVPAGFFAVLAYFTGAEVDALFVTALLALLGYSVNDTIVIFDRVREHLVRNEKNGTKESFETTIGKSISETLTRSINTSLTVVLALLALVLFGATATSMFALVLLVGVIAGTYSSVLLAAPLLIPLSKRFIK